MSREFKESIPPTRQEIDRVLDDVELVMRGINVLFAIEAQVDCIDTSGAFSSMLTDYLPDHRPELLQAYLERSLEDANPKIREAATGYLSSLAKTDAVLAIRLLELALDDPDQAVGMTASETLYSISEDSVEGKNDVSTEDVDRLRLLADQAWQRLNLT